MFHYHTHTKRGFDLDYNLCFTSQFTYEVIFSIYCRAPCTRSQEHANLLFYISNCFSLCVPIVIFGNQLFVSGQSPINFKQVWEYTFCEFWKCYIVAGFAGFQLYLIFYYALIFWWIIFHLNYLFEYAYHRKKSDYVHLQPLERARVRCQRM